MDIQRDHVIHLENGRFAAGSSRDELSRILKRALDANPGNGLVLHFHGGLVDEDAARGIADRLAPIYADVDGAYPLFFVWESGVWETIWNNLGEIRKERFFQELVKKAGEWVLKQLPGDVAVRGGGGGMVDERKLRQDLDAWFSGTTEELPEPLRDDGTATTGRTRGTVPDERRLAEQIEAALDREFKAAVEAVYNGLNVQGADQPATRGIGSRASAQSLISPTAADAMFERSAVRTRGLLSWAKVAVFVAKIVIACIKRFMAGRSHGLYPTVVEEVLRAAYGDKVGSFIWDSMKKDTADAFVAGEETGGYALLDELRRQAEQGRRFAKITLVGHSTGAIFICHFLAAAATQWPGQKFDVVFLAPAVTHELFAATLAEHRDLIGNFRMFGMRDAVERKDQMVKILYPRSLLYFVSGLLEPEVDIPLVGMQRYLNEQDVFTSADFPQVAAVAQFLGQVPDSKVWSVITAGPGTSSHAEAHGDFDNDQTTLDSVVHILRSGF